MRDALRCPPSALNDLSPHLLHPSTRPPQPHRLLRLHRCTQHWAVSSPHLRSPLPLCNIDGLYTPRLSHTVVCDLIRSTELSLGKCSALSRAFDSGLMVVDRDGVGVPIYFYCEPFDTSQLRFGSTVVVRYAERLIKS